MTQTDADDLSATLPPAVPAFFWLYDAEERLWRGRAAAFLAVSGFSAATAWRAAMSKDSSWTEHLRDRVSSLPCGWLEGAMLRRRLVAIRTADLGIGPSETYYEPVPCDHAD